MDEETSIFKALWDACDLVVNNRGIGWSWSCSRYAHYGPPQSRIKYLFKTLVRIICHALCADVAAEIAQALLPTITNGHPTILDPTLPLLQRLLHASILTGIYISIIYCTVDMSYHIIAFCCVSVVGYAPEQWPPVFDAPWRSTSVGDFWGKRWHQFLRYYVVSLGSQPLIACLATPTVASSSTARKTCQGGATAVEVQTKRGALSVLSAFFVSGVLHDLSFRALRKGGEPMQMIGFFVMQGVGVVLERAVSERWSRVRLTERPWSWHNAIARIWVLSWLLVWGIPFVEVTTKAGMYNVQLFPEPVKPLRVIRAVSDMIITNLDSFVPHFL